MFRIVPRRALRRFNRASCRMVGKPEIERLAVIDVMSEFACYSLGERIRAYLENLNTFTAKIRGAVRDKGCCAPLASKRNKWTNWALGKLRHRSSGEKHGSGGPIMTVPLSQGKEAGLYHVSAG